MIFDRYRQRSSKTFCNAATPWSSCPPEGGKSLCYQLPALSFDGLTVVVSPLISLMQDQVTQLRQLGVRAVFLNSTLSHHEYVSTADRLRTGEVKLLYLAPEALLRAETLRLLDDCRLECLAIDESPLYFSMGARFSPGISPTGLRTGAIPSRRMCCADGNGDASCPKPTSDRHWVSATKNEFIASFDRSKPFHCRRAEDKPAGTDTGLPACPSQSVGHHLLRHPSTSGLAARGTGGAWVPGIALSCRP